MRPSDLSLLALRGANLQRQAEWDPDKQITLTYSAMELGGEVGEALNVAKKLERERLGIQGSRATIDDLGDELADVIICADLLAMRAGIDLAARIVGKFNATSEKVGLQTRLEADNVVGAAEREVGRYIYRLIEARMNAAPGSVQGVELAYLAEIVADVEEYGADALMSDADLATSAPSTALTAALKRAAA